MDLCNCAKIYEETYTFSINIRLAAAEAFISATNGGVLCSFTSPLACVAHLLP